MKIRFDPRQGLIVVNAYVKGPVGRATMRLALDTGASQTIIPPSILFAVGLDPVSSPQRVMITTGSGIEYVRQLQVPSFQALRQTKRKFTVLAHSLPASARIDGRLGLDFMEGQLLTVNFKKGYVELRTP